MSAVAAASAAPEPILYNKRQAARFLNCSVRTLDRCHDIPRIRIGSPMNGRVMFRRDTLDQWAKSKESS